MSKTPLDAKQFKTLTNLVSEYLDDFLIVGYDPADNGKYIFRCGSAKTARSVLSLAEDTIYHLNNPPHEE